MNKWTKDYKKYLKDAKGKTIDDLYEYRDRQEKHFWAILISGSIVLGILIAALFI